MGIRKSYRSPEPGSRESVPLLQRYSEGGDKSVSEPARWVATKDTCRRTEGTCHRGPLV